CLSYPAPPTSDTAPLSLHDALPICNSWRHHDDDGSLAPSCVEHGHGGRESDVGLAHPDLVCEYNAWLIVQPMQDLRRGALLTIGDRKSTRLNSSHLGISYAVFCLKK